MRSKLGSPQMDGLTGFKTLVQATNSGQVSFNLHTERPDS